MPPDDEREIQALVPEFIKQDRRSVLDVLNSNTGMSGPKSVEQIGQDAIDREISIADIQMSGLASIGPNCLFRRIAQDIQGFPAARKKSLASRCQPNFTLASLQELCANRALKITNAPAE